MTPHKETMGSLELMSGLYYRAWQTVKPTPETLRKVNRGSSGQHPIQLPAVAEPARGLCGRSTQFARCPGIGGEPHSPVDMRGLAKDSNWETVSNTSCPRFQRSLVRAWTPRRAATSQSSPTIISSLYTSCTSILTHQLALL